MANEEETYAVKVGQYWHVRRVRDNMTVGYITEPKVVSVMKSGNEFFCTHSDGKTSRHNWRGAFIGFVY
jgi:hypothetical protein